MGGINNLTNQRFGKLLVMRKVICKIKIAFWYCHCDCGNEAVVAGSNLTKGTTKSCGCIQSEFTKSRNATHGLRKHPLYRVWHGIIQRCTKSYSVSYSNYGGKGVSVCQEWYDFKNFYDWAIANGYRKGLFIDKDIIPKMSGIAANTYSPATCCFVTTKENNRYRSTTKLTIESANEIRASNEKTSALMKKYGVGRTTIVNIRSNKSWV